MVTIVTRAGKGSALTWTEGDANITNLNNGKLENIVEDTSPQLGGNLDVNGKKIVSTSNGNIVLEPNGTGQVTTPATFNANILASTQSSGDEGGQIELALAATNNLLTGSVAIDINQSQLRIFETGGSNRGVYINLSSAATGVGTNLLAGGGMTSFTVAGDTGTSQTVSDGNTLTISGGTGLSSVASATDTITINLDNTSVSAGSYTLASITVDAQGRITSASNGSARYPSITDDTTTNSTHYVVLEDATSGSASTVKVSSTKLTFNPSTGIVTATGFSGPHNGTVGATTPASGAFTTLSASSTVSGTGFSTYLASPPAIGGSAAAAGTFTTLTASTSASLKAITEGALFDLGTTGGTVAPNVANGNVQKITLNSALTMNAFTSPVAGQTLTLIIYGGTAYTSITSTMKFAGGVKTLTGTAGCIDILSVYYDGTNYFASLGKGFA